MNMLCSPLRRLSLALLMLLAGCWSAEDVRWHWAKVESQVLSTWGERQIVALDLGMGIDGQFYLAAPKLEPVTGSRELLWLNFSGEVEFSIGGGELVYRPVPVELRVRSRLRSEEGAYLLLEPEVQSMQLEFPLESMRSLLAQSLAPDLSKVLADKPLFAEDSMVRQLRQRDGLQLDIEADGLRFSVPQGR